MKQVNVTVVAVLMVGAQSTVYAEATVYASIRQALVYTKTDVAGTSSVQRITDLEAVDGESRVGLQGNQQLGEITGFGRLEWGIDATTQSSSPETRLGYAGISGEFGTLSFGSQWSAWDTFVGDEHTNFVNEGAWHNGARRNGSTLKYAGQFGGLSLEADAVLIGTAVATSTTLAENEGVLDEIQLALGYNFGAVTVQAGWVERDGGATGYQGGGSLVGGRITYDAGGTTVALAIAQDDDRFGGMEETLGVKLRAEYVSGPNLFRLVVTQADNKTAGNTPAGIAIGYQYDLSARARVALEMSSVDPDIAGLDATTEGGVMYRHDW